MGSGGIGGYFGAQLAQAGNDVTFVARGAQLAALRDSGLNVHSELAPVQLARVNVTDDPARAGLFEVVMFCVKLWDVESAIEQIAPAVAPGGLAIPFQNGIETHPALIARLGAARVAGGVAYIAVAATAPGVVTHTGKFAKLRVGMFAGATPAPLSEFVAAGKAAGIDIDTVADIERALWEKLVFLAAFSGVTAATRQPIGALRADADLRALLRSSMLETVAVARALGTMIEADYVERQMHFIDTMPAAAQSSLLTDLAAGRRLEVQWLSGAVARLAHATSVAAPVNATLYAILKPFVDGNPRRH